MSFLSIKLNPAGSDKLFQTPRFTTLKLTYGFIIIGILNFLLEVIIRQFIFNKILSDNLVESVHIIIFFIVPFIYIGMPKLKTLIAWASFCVITVFISLLIYKNFIPPLWNIIYFLTYPLLIYFIITEKSKLHLLGFSIRFWKNIILYSSLATIILIAHLLFVVSLSPYPDLIKLNIYSKLPEILTEIGFSIIGMEIFYRGFLFNQLFRVAKYPFGLAALVSTLFYVLPFFSNRLFLSNIAIGFATIFYAAIIGFVFCYLYKKTNSIWPSFIASLFLFIARILILR